MIRKAVLIESSQVSKHGKLPGASKDVESWKGFLMSPAGGAWRPDEIKEFHTPAWRDVEAALNNAHYCDYVFIAFAGHGYWKGGKTYACLNNDVDASSEDFDRNFVRSCIVLDSCRGVIAEETILAFSDAMGLIVNRASPDIAAYRKLFEDKVSGAGYGRQTVYSCDLDQSADEDPRQGGFFTYGLISGARAWHKRTPYGRSSCYSMSSAVGYARTTLVEGQQDPVVEGEPDFPFAVKP